ncbi:MAG: hypothetical protein ACERLM_14455, partial [Acidimicrobiales bacterium]
PGSAGTAQEVFQDAAQNHYETFGPPSSMVFLDRRHAADRPYAELLHLVDTPEEAVAALSEPGGVRIRRRRRRPRCRSAR